MGKTYYCVCCNKKAKPKDRRSLTEVTRRYLRKYLPVHVNLSESDVVCFPCRIKAHKHVQKSSTTTLPDTCTTHNNDQDYQPQPCPSREPLSPLSVTLQIPSTSRSHSRCFVCKRPGPKLISLPSEGRLSAFLVHNVIVPADSRCCPVHTDDGTLTIAAVHAIQTLTKTALLNRTGVNDLLQKMRKMFQQQSRHINFDHLSDSDFESLTKLDHTQFEDLYSYLSDKIKNTPNRSIKTSIGIFLFKLSSGMSNKLLSTIFGITKSSIRRAIASVRNAFMRGFVPLFLGVDCMTRESLINDHTRPLAKTLFGDKEENLILVLDGTYIYIHKSNNFSFQRRSFSLHKGRPLVKPMVVVTTTGRFVTIVGPYLSDGRNNDAAILNHMLKTNIEDIKGLLREGDVFVVDRGFRDALPLLSDLGIQAEMPAIMKKGDKQLSTEDANSSRLVTKIRWVVESANARIKRFKYLDNVIPNSQLPFVGDYVRIVCALSNKYFPPLSSPDQIEKDEFVANQMLQQNEKTNQLQLFVEEKGLSRKVTIWRPIQELELDGFPRLTEEQLSDLTLGVYQLRLSSSYIQEHLSGNCDINVHVSEPTLLSVKLQSRHTSSRKYMLWIRYNQKDIESWYCQCKTGSRVVGMCSHIAAVIWYLSSARYQQSERFGVRDWAMHMSDAACIEESSSSDSD